MRLTVHYKIDVCYGDDKSFDDFASCLICLLMGNCFLSCWICCGAKCSGGRNNAKADSNHREYFICEESLVTALYNFIETDFAEQLVAS